MNRKNSIGRTLRSGLMVAAAATLIMGNMAVYAAEDDEEGPAGYFWQEDLISGTVTEVGDSAITIRVSGTMEEVGFGMSMPGGGMQMGMPGGQGGMPEGMPQGERPEGMPQDGQTPPELPEGELPELPEGIDDLMGQMPQGGRGMGMPGGQGGMPEGMSQGERPEGMPQDGQTPPELPEGELPERPEGEPQGERPEGMPQGGQGMGMPSMGGLGSEVVVSVDGSTIITKGSDEASLSDVSVGSRVMVSLEGDTAIAIMILS